MTILRHPEFISGSGSRNKPACRRQVRDDVFYYEKNKALDHYFSSSRFCDRSECYRNL